MPKYTQVELINLDSVGVQLPLELIQREKQYDMFDRRWAYHEKEINKGWRDERNNGKAKS